MNIIKKAFVGTLIVVIMAVLLTACSEEAGLVITDTSMKMTNNEFTGTETHIVSLTAGTVITVDIVSKSGSLDISICDESGNIIGSGVGIEGGVSFGVNTDGEYMINIVGLSHQGSVMISWK